MKGDANVTPEEYAKGMSLVYTLLCDLHTRLKSVTRRLEELEQGKRPTRKAKPKGGKGGNAGHGSDRHDPSAQQADNSLD